MRQPHSPYLVACVTNSRLLRNASSNDGNLGGCWQELRFEATPSALFTGDGANDAFHVGGDVDFQSALLRRGVSAADGEQDRKINPPFAVPAG